MPYGGKIPADLLHKTTRERNSVGCIMNKISYITDSKSGIVTSPDYPNKYPSYANCIWEIIVPDGTELNLIFLTFNTEKKANPTVGFFHYSV